MAQEARRKNGFEWPWRKRQCLAIVIFGATGLFSACIMLPLLRGVLRWSFAALFWLSWFILFISAYIAMQVDPVDSNVGCSLSAQPIPGQPWCSICEASVRTDSKHCWECNKCVGNFDHHCPWLNTCIGTRNYGTFFVTIWSLLVMLSVVIGFAVALLAGRDTSLFGLGEHLTTGLLITLVVLYFPLWCLDLSLVVFHCFLCWKDITTYEYLTGKTKRPPPPISPKPQSTASSDRQHVCPVEVGARSISGLTASSLVSAVELPRTVSEFMFGAPAPADPAEVDPLDAREAMKVAHPRDSAAMLDAEDPPPPRHRVLATGEAGAVANATGPREDRQADISIPQKAAERAVTGVRCNAASPTEERKPGPSRPDAAEEALQETAI
uniref:Palmitoyltransferase n=1 Tax=Pyrodinium bahamense TaxID=73915 RepID=A0A6T8VD82_9DINO|mmetsp:Transcript_28606/g.78521  ORF Transcript_28606/g.78521 Transcript_28606/m.78521 type:complete len:382 (+) Transcript_28606:74-1219(+)